MHRMHPWNLCEFVRSQSKEGRWLNEPAIEYIRNLTGVDFTIKARWVNRPYLLNLVFAYSCASGRACG